MYVPIKLPRTTTINTNKKLLSVVKDKIPAKNKDNSLGKKLANPFMNNSKNNAIKP